MLKSWSWSQWALVGLLMMGNATALLICTDQVRMIHPETSKVLMTALDDTQHSGSTFQRAVITESRQLPVRVPLEQDDRALMLEATLDHHRKARMILDTGATYTAISRELADELGYDLRHARRVNITTATGQVSLPRVTLKSLTLNGYTAYNVEATVMNMPENVPFSGLLGLSFVKHHRITIDSEQEHLVIEPKT